MALSWNRATRDDETTDDIFAESYRISEYLRSLSHQDSISVREGVRVRRLLLRRQFLAHYWGGPPRWRLALRSFGAQRTLPDFVCTGAIKSGTSDLSTYLFQHPGIVPPLTKEIFSADPDQWRPHYPTQTEKQRVSSAVGAAMSGYFAPWMHDISLMDGFRSVKPDGKIVLVLRNPVDRAYSHYKWDLFLGGRDLPAEQPYYRTYSDYVQQALDSFPATSMPSRSGFPFLHSGIYVQSVRAWMDRFGADSVCVITAEDFFRHPIDTVVGVQRFLGLDPIPPQRHRTALNINPLEAPRQDDDARASLTEFYRPWNERLEDLLDRDLGWGRNANAVSPPVSVAGT